PVLFVPAPGNRTTREAIWNPGPVTSKEVLMVATTTATPPMSEPETAADIGIIRVHHINFYVNDIGDWANYFIHRFNFREVAHGGPYSGKGDRVCRVVGHGRIRFILTQAAYRESVVAGFLRKHPQGVADIAFLVHDAMFAL